ncbi:MAG: FtsK/SpoIIIE family [Chloroflexota bacterium]
MAGYRNVVVERGQQFDQAERDGLPDWQRARGWPEPRPVRASWDWRPLLAVVLLTGGTAIFLLWRFVTYLADASRATTWLDAYLIAALKVTLFVGPIVAVLIGLYWLWNKARAAGVVQLPNTMPVAIADVLSPDWQPAALDSMHAFYATEQTWARNSALRSLNQLDLSRAFTGVTPEVIDAEPTAPAQLPAPDAPTRLTDLLARNLIARSGTEWLVGFDGQGVPQYLDWAASPLTLVCGNSNQGKSNTTRLLALQAALNPVEPIGLVLADPHAAHPEKSLARTCAALEPAYLLPVAGDATSIIDAARFVARVLDSRKADAGLARPPVLFICDEFNALMDGDSFDERDELARIVRVVGREGNKFNVRALLIIHTLTANMVGGSALRDLGGAKVIHNLQPNQSRLLISNPETARLVASLGQGEAVVLRGLGSTPTRVRVPPVPREELETLRYRVRPAPAIAMPDADDAAVPEVPPARQSIVHSARDKAIIALFQRRCTYEQVRAHCKRLGLKVDQNELPRLRRAALGAAEEDA